jgi:hypothetical protein
MRTVLATLVLGACALLASAPAATAQRVGDQAPEFKPVKWYQSPPLTMEQLRGKAVLLVVFRTW